METAQKREVKEGCCVGGGEGSLADGQQQWVNGCEAAKDGRLWTTTAMTD
jgi:hypothetical protein